MNTDCLVYKFKLNHILNFYIYIDLYFSPIFKSLHQTFQISLQFKMYELGSLGVSRALTL